MRRLQSIQAAFVGGLLLTACGGGSDSAALEGLAPPANLSVVEPLGEDSPGGSFVAPGASSYPPDSAYVTDLQDVNVYDPSLEPLRVINMILCAVGRTGARDMVNEGPYIAQVNFAECEVGGDSGSDDPSSGSASDTFELWTVESSRASNAVPQQNYIWVPPSDDSPQEIIVDMVVTEGASETNAFGAWNMKYAGVGEFETVSNPTMRGSLATLSGTAPGFDFYEIFGDVDVVPDPNSHAAETLASVELSADQTTGRGRVQNSFRTNFGGDSGILTDEYLVAFDETHFMRETVTGGTGDGGTVFHRDQVSENVWRYGLYHATGPNAGDRVEINSGFSIQNMNGDYGFVGYYGLWAPDSADFSDGTTVSSRSYGEDPVDYTVFRAPGKLIKNSRAELALDQLDGMLFEWPTSDGMGNPILKQVTYNEGSSQWTVVGERTYSADSFTPVDPAEIVDTSLEQYLGFWSQELGGSASYVHGDTFLSYFTEETVIATDDFFGTGTELELFGFVQCLDSGITTADAESGDVYLPDAPDEMTPYRFVFDRETMTLQYDSDGMGTMVDVGLGAGQTISTGPNSWGMRSGPLVASTSGYSSIYDVWSETEYYIYETGPNSWNSYSGLKDAQGQIVPFEAPLRIRYRHVQTNDRNDDATYEGRNFLFEYQGVGNLHGIPHEGVDLSGDGNPDRYYPLFGLKDGITLGDADEYVLKALSIEQRLLEDTSYAGALTLTGVDVMTLPDPALWTAPTNPVKPVVTDAPRVIDGELVDDDE